MSMPSTSLQKLFEQMLESRSNEPAKKKTIYISPKQVQDMETAYAEALGDGADAQTLAALWEEIRKCKHEESQFA